MDNEILQITIEPRKLPKTKFGRWWENKISYPFYLFKLKFKAWFFGGVYNLMLSLMSKEKREKIKEEDREITINIINETGDEDFAEFIKNSLKENHNLEEADDVEEAIKKAISDLKNEI